MGQNHISLIELFAFNNNAPVLYKIDQSKQKWVIILKIYCGEQIGLGECDFTTEVKSIDLIKWGSFLINIRKCTLEEAMTIVHCKGLEWEDNKLLLVYNALLQLVQTQQLRMKVAVGTTGRDSFINTNNLQFTSSSQMRGRRYDLDNKSLFDESSAYYSIF